jgi:hypothetical protein
MNNDLNAGSRAGILWGILSPPSRLIYSENVVLSGDRRPGSVTHSKYLKAFVLSLLLLMLCLNAHSTILSVALDGSQDFTVIQEAIDASAQGDTVLVYPGRYYENLRFNGKNITLASKELIKGDPAFIYDTIIDGNQNGAVISVMDREQNIHIQGFTITNGSGVYSEMYGSTFGGGICTYNMCGVESPTIVNCVLTGNKADYGGGMFVRAEDLYLSGISIRKNYAAEGGGLWFGGHLHQAYNGQFDPVNRCSIYSNYAASGSDLFYSGTNTMHVVVDTFTVANPWNFYTSGAYPNSQSSEYSNPFILDILHTIHEEMNHDLYVAPWGDDSNSGLSPAEPVQSIFMAMYRIASDPDNPKTVHVADGTYSSSRNGQHFPIPLKSHTNLIGTSKEGTILNSESCWRTISAAAQSENWTIGKLSINNGRRGIYFQGSKDIKIHDILIEDLHDVFGASGITGNYVAGNTEITDVKISKIQTPEGAFGLSLSDALGSIKLENLEMSNTQARTIRAIRISTIRDCEVSMNGCEVFNNNGSFWDSNREDPLFHISPVGSSPTRLRIDMRNSAFYDNHQGTHRQMATARSLNDTLFISNCTFAGNTGSSSMQIHGTNVISNNIIRNPELTWQILIPDRTSSGINSHTTVMHNNILGGIDAVHNSTAANPLIWGPGNSSDDPLFVNEGNRPYLLSALSPLIDMGLQPVILEPALDAAGNERYWDGDGDGLAVIDLGAYEYQTIYSPLELYAELWQQQILLSWQMPPLDRGLSGFRIYRNGQPYAEIADPQTTHFRDYSAVNDTLTYFLVALYGAVESSPSNSVTVIIDTVSNEDEQVPPASISLKISPNPFRDLAVISYQLSKPSETELKIYNLKGQLVRVLLRGTAESGEQVLAWEGCDDKGQALPAGVYLLRLSIDGKKQKPLKMLKL